MTATALKCVQGQGGLPCVVLQAANGATAHVYLQGAHVTCWQVPGLGQQLFLSQAADFAEGKALRGGVPVIFPQFGLFGTGPKHGFARTAQWQLDANASDAHRAVLRLTQAPAGVNPWPYAFEACLEATLLPMGLTIGLSITNTDSRPFSFTSALHSYFAVAQLQQTRIEGLEACSYWDNGTPLENRHAPQNQPLAVTGALDRVYFQTPAHLTLLQPHQQLHIHSQGFVDTVVWNPGAEGAAALPDMLAEEYTQMLCIESAVVDTPIYLQPGQQWTGVQALQVQAAAS